MMTVPRVPGTVPGTLATVCARPLIGARHAGRHSHSLSQGESRRSPGTLVPGTDPSSAPRLARLGHTFECGHIGLVRLGGDHGPPDSLTRRHRTRSVLGSDTVTHHATQ